ncbi:hypothetical protein [Vineibacter terrae]|nr:hypothetical protein [Vineibacter terrae]
MVLDHAPEPLADIAPGEVVRFFLGQDDIAVVLAPSDIQRELNDPFARLVLTPGHRPKNLVEVLKIIDLATGADAVPGQRIYRIADGGQIPWNDETATLDRHLRIAITRHRGEEAELFISTAPPFSSETIFLQIFAWDPKSGAYNFYERRRGVWSWAGSSWQALMEPTRGRGPFDSHVNGGPVMKELKLPWMHWHSQSSQIRDDIFAPDDPFPKDPLWNSSNLKGAEDLELIVRSGTARWTRSRFDRRTANGRLSNAREFLRQILTTTTVNLACSPQPSASLSDDDMLRLPTTFFLNSDCLVGELALPATLSRAKTPASFYRAGLEKYEVCLRDGGNIFKRDTHFAFPVPEPSLEDQMVLRELLARGAISRRLALCLLMVDFPNPVFSDRRATLLEHIPEALVLDGGADLDGRFPAAVKSVIASKGADSAEAEFTMLWETAGDWEMEFAARVDRYWALVLARLLTAEGFDAFFQLAESRRRQFRNRPLAEFGLTLPVATKLDLPAFLSLTEQAQVRPL